MGEPGRDDSAPRQDAGTARDAGMAKHAWLRQVLAKEITETLAPNQMLAPERDLAARFGVSRMTIRQALRALTNQGVIYSVRGVGTFVAEPRVRKDPTLTSFSEDMRSRGLRPGSRLLSADLVDAETAVAAELGVEPGAPVYRVERLRLADDVPLCHEQSFLPARLFPGLTDQDLEGSLYELLASRYRVRVVRAQQTTRAVNLSRRLATLLDVPARAAALHVHRVGMDARGRIAERTDSLYRGDRYDFAATITRAHPD